MSNDSGERIGAPGRMLSDTDQGGPVSIVSPNQRRDWRLVLAHSADPSAVGQRFEFAAGETNCFGRDAALGHGVLDGRMSRQHFCIGLKRGGLEFTDTGSTNGTFVDGVMTKACRLAQGSVIRAGDSIFVVVAGDAQLLIEQQVQRCAASRFPILIQGETGTGKELLARSIHERSGRGGSFVPLNCATLSRELVTAELFGHAKGAFSGAIAARAGLFRSAHGGTLFLDEIGDLPLDLQASLLRAVEESRVRPVGSDQEIPIDVRVICATHVDLMSAMHAQHFRTDLYARLARIVFRLPPLRERRHDVIALANQFSAGAALTYNAAEALVLWNWPRNIRELRNLIEVATLMAREPRKIHLSDLTAQLPAIDEPQRLRMGITSNPAPAKEGSSVHPLVDRREQLAALLEAHGGNVSQAAQQLGKPRAQIYRWAKSLGIDTTHFRK